MSRITLAQRFSLLLLALLIALPIGSVSTAQAAPAVAGPDTSPVWMDAIHLLSSTDDETFFQVQADVYRMENVEGVDGPCQRIAVDGFETGGEAGAPGLPMRSVLLGIPVDATPSLEIISQPVRLPGSYTLCPAPDAVAEEIDGQMVQYVEQETGADSGIYSQNALFPAAASRIVTDGWVGRLRFVRVEISPFQYNPVDGSLIQHTQMQVRVRHSGSSLQAVSANQPDSFTQSTQGMLLNGALAGQWAATSQPTVDAAANAGWTPPLPALRLFVKEEGLYAVTYAELEKAGVPLASISSHNLRLYLNGQDVAVRVVDSNNVDDVDGIFQPGDSLLFYGQGVDEKYTDANVYWLHYGAADSLHMRTQSQATGGVAVNSYRATARFEENFNYVSSAPKKPGYNHWYGRLLTVAGANAANSWQLPLTASFVASGNYTATIQTAMVSRTNGTHHAKLYVNGVYVGDGQWSGADYQNFSVDFDQALLKTGANTFRVEIVNDLNEQKVSVVYLDWLQLSYQRQINAVGDRLIFDSPGAGAWRYSAGGFSNGALEAYDVTDPFQVVYIPVASGTGAASNGTAFSTTESASHRYLVQRTAQRRQVASIEQADTANLLASDKRVNYIIITHPDFLDSVQRLADYRASHGLSVEVVNVQHVYDVFNYGRMSPQAIRDFLTHTFWNWQSSYVVLVGDGTFDPRTYRSDSAPTFIPPYLAMVDPDLGETAADNFYVAFVGSDPMPDMYLGRLPAESPADVTAMVDKIIDYESAPADSGWNRNVLFVSDDLKGGGGAFYNYSNAIADGTSAYNGEMVNLLPDAYEKERLYLPFDCATGDACREDLVSLINRGTLLISYVGHSAKEYWAEENILNLAAVSQLNNEYYPIMLPMTCLEGYYHEAEKGRMSLGEALVRRANGGAIASWSSSGLGLASGHDYLERGFFISVFYNGLTEMGVATNQGKLYLSTYAPTGKYDDLMHTFTLLGDPALRVRTLDSVPKARTYGLFLPAVIR